MWTGGARETRAGAGWPNKISGMAVPLRHFPAPLRKPKQTEAEEGKGAGFEFTWYLVTTAPMVAVGKRVTPLPPHRRRRQ